MTERLHFSLSCIGEGNGNPLQCSCLENPRDGGAWWAAVSGVAQSWTRLKQLSSSSSSFWGVLTLTVYVKSYHLMEKYLQCTKTKFFQAVSQYPESSVQLKKMYSHKNILKIYPPLTFKHFLKLSFTFKHFIR